MSKKPGRPKSDERFTKFLYVRLREEQWAALEAVALSQGFAVNGGRSAAARFCIDRMAALVKVHK